jgi:DNA-binding response OmpR family regulator
MAARVLVIDDSQTTLSLIVSSLQAAGIESDSASDLKTVDARLANANNYEVVLVDVNMPEMFGDDVLEFLREAKSVKGKLLLYSDLPEDELVERAQSSRADGYILKSQGVEAAIEEVKKYLSEGAAPAKAAAPARSRRVLVVDDSEATGKLLEAELKAKGYEVFTAKSAEDGTRLILNKKTRPDLVLLDVRMPGVDGESFCRFIKKNSLFAGIRVILCSAMEETELKAAAVAAGADGYVRKDSVIAAEILAHLS